MGHNCNDMSPFNGVDFINCTPKRPDNWHAIQVLTTGSWPAQSTAQCHLPQDFKDCCDEFQKFYLRARTGRRLSWQTNMGTSDIQACFGNKKHLLVMSTYQACIVLLFNSAEQLTYREIADATGIAPLELKRNLQSLACAKGKQILTKEPASRDINEDDLFSVNERFASKLFR